MLIKILDQEWIVEKVEPHSPELFVDNKWCLGTEWPARQRINISSELSSDRALRTITHELCHAYLDATQANRPESWDEEAICDLMAIYGALIVAEAKRVYQELFRGVVASGGSHNEAELNTSL